MESWPGSVSVVGVDDIVVGGDVAADGVDADAGAGAEADVGVVDVACAEVVAVDDASVDSPDVPVDGIPAPCDHSQGRQKVQEAVLVDVLHDYESTENLRQGSRHQYGSEISSVVPLSLSQKQQSA